MKCTNPCDRITGYPTQPKSTFFIGHNHKHNPHAYKRVIRMCMGFSRFMLREGKVNYNSPLNFALHVESALLKFNLGRNKRKNKTIPTPVTGQRCESIAFYFSGWGLGKKVTVPFFSIQYGRCIQVILFPHFPLLILAECCLLECF